MAHVASYCLARVKDEDGWQTHVDCLCNWRKGNRLLELIIDSFKSVLVEEDKSTGSSKGVRFVEADSKDNQLKVAIKLVKYLLEHQTNRILLMYKHKPVLEELMQVLIVINSFHSYILHFLFLHIILQKRLSPNK